MSEQREHLPAKAAPDLLDATAAAELLGVSESDFIRDVQLLRLPAPALRWEGKGRRRKARPLWRRAELLSADFRRRAARIAGCAG